MRALAWTLAALLALAPAVLPAQEGTAQGPVRSPVLTIDVDRLLAETRMGQRLAADIRERTEALAQENERLRLELTAEEQSLTERRPTMEVEAFRAEAEAFDVRVQRIRAEQDAKQRALETALTRGRDGFLNAVTPVLAGLMIESGAAVILERRDVFLSAGLVDITDEAIAAIDAELGEGPPPAAPEEDRPEPAADPATDPAPEAPPGPESDPQSDPEADPTALGAPEPSDGAESEAADPLADPSAGTP